jgi:hypothetical protein
MDKLSKAILILMIVIIFVQVLLFAQIQSNLEMIKSVQNVSLKLVEHNSEQNDWITSNTVNINELFKMIEEVKNNDLE